MIEYLQDGLYQLKNKQTKGAKLHASIRWELRERNAPKTFFKVLERQNMQNQTISELYTDNNKSKYSGNPKDILKSAKRFYEKLYLMETTLKAATTEFLSKFPNRKEVSNEQCNLCEAKISLDEIIKSINSQINNKSPGNYGLTAEIYKHFSNEFPVLLDVYDSWGKLGTMSVTSKTGMISVIY